MKAYRASSKHGAVTRDTPRAAASAFFETFPAARKCRIVEGTTDGPFFTVVYGRADLGQWPQSWVSVTRKSLDTLPN